MGPHAYRSAVFATPARDPQLTACQDPTCGKSVGPTRQARSGLQGHSDWVGSQRGRAAGLGTVGFAVVLLTGCSPLNQGAVTLDETTQLPTLVMTFCDGEGAEAVRLTEARDDGNGWYEGRTLWRIEASEPRPVETVVAGDVPEGFREVVALPAELPDDDFVMMAENGGHGMAAEQGSGPFSLSELEPGVLFQDGTERSLAGLRRDAGINCSDSLFGSLGLPTRLDGVAAGLAGAAVLVLGARVLPRGRGRGRPSSPTAPHP